MTITLNWSVLRLLRKLVEAQPEPSTTIVRLLGSYGSCSGGLRASCSFHAATPNVPTPAQIIRWNARRKTPFLGLMGAGAWGPAGVGLSGEEVPGVGGVLPVVRDVKSVRAATVGTRRGWNAGRARTGAVARPRIASSWRGAADRPGIDGERTAVRQRCHRKTRCNPKQGETRTTSDHRDAALTMPNKHGNREAGKVEDGRYGWLAETQRPSLQPPASLPSQSVV